MTRGVQRGLIVALIHVTLVASIGAKLLVDRSIRPRVWVRAAPYDPELPIRGRYVRLRIEARPGPGFDASVSYERPVDLEVSDGALVAIPAEGSPIAARISTHDDRSVAVITEPVAYFIPEHVPDPSLRPPGEELWVEVTVPGEGPPRPIRLGVRKDGRLTPLDVR